MGRSWLAIDLGASGGRHILGYQDADGRLCTEEIYRFENGAETVGGQLLWNTERLFSEIQNGLRECGKRGIVPLSVGIDTWAVDFVLLDAEGQRIGNCVAYRDSRTKGVPEELSAIISQEELYSRTGIQKQEFNTIYQLYTVRGELSRADRLLMLPEYFNYLLTGVKMNEYTNATSTGLVNAAARTWDEDIIRRLGYPRRVFGELNPPGTFVGRLKPEIAGAVGFDCDVVLPATHDTASAVAAIPLKSDDSVYISSGTWSLMGTENRAPITTEASRKLNLTNEGGVEYRYRYLKNIMGLWMIQSVRAELPEKLSYAELAALAEKETGFTSAVDASDGRFLSPRSMTAEIQAACRESAQPVPETVGQLAKCIFISLAKCNADAVKQLSDMTGKRFKAINIVGGGCKNDCLNRLTAAESGLPVIAGPSEATALGNIAVQMIRSGAARDIDHIRTIIAESFDTKEIRA